VFTQATGELCMRIFSFSLMGCLIFSLSGLANVGLPELPEIREVNLNVERVFVPKGFDSNDNSEIVVTGWYPNPCYEWSRSIVRKEAGEIDVQLKAFVKRGMDTVCIDMAVPYMESIKLGSLQEGISQLFIDDISAEMSISEAGSSSIDDHLYGQVRHIRAQNKALILEIENPSDCITLDEIKTVFNGENTCSVLPIMKKVKEHCPRQPETHHYYYEIPEECLSAEKVLFHVRSLEGKAVNFLFRNK
jgi:hypothetical protein